MVREMLDKKFDLFCRDYVYLNPIHEKIDKEVFVL